MKLKILDIFYQDLNYKFNGWLGLMLVKTEKTEKKLCLHEKVKKPLMQVNHPYLLIPYSRERIINISTHKKIAYKLAKVYTFLCLKSFLFVRLLSLVRFQIFETTEEAIFFYRKVFPNKQQNLCLPRALFAACTSKSFKKNGVIFIGVFLPSKAMHAWIIEEDKQPDIYDDIWICYQPVAVMYYK